jgi:hypothetical protein
LYLAGKECKQDTKIIIKIMVELTGKGMYFHQVRGKSLQGRNMGLGFKDGMLVKTLGLFGHWDNLLDLGPLSC